ncbi:MAG: hypothetical protein AAFP80_00600 [Pseudomonadota bacterium]
MKFLRAQRLNDKVCNYADLLRDTLDRDTYEVLWIGALATLRAVGHTIKHEAKSDEKARRIVSDRHRLSADNPKMNWLLESRNLALKENDLRINVDEANELEVATTAGIRPAGTYKELGVFVQSAVGIFDIPYPEEIICDCVYMWDQEILAIRADERW